MKKELFVKLLLALYLVVLVFAGCVNEESGCVVGKYEITDGSSQVEIPFEMYGLNIMLHAQMNGVNIKLLLDNGVMWDELWFYGNDQVDSLGFTFTEDTVQITGAGEGEGVHSGFAGCPDIHFPGVVFADQTALVSPKDQGFYKMFPGIAGQICGTILRNFITEFNFDDNHITLNKKERFDTDKYPCKVQMKVDSMGSYHIPVTVKYGDHVVKRRIYLDLGGVFPLTLVTNNDFPLRGDEVKKHVANGASGPIYGYNTRVDYLQIGQYKLKDLETILTEDETGGDHTNQTIGLPLLMHFNMAFDYFNNVLYLVPNKRFKEQAK